MSQVGLRGTRPQLNVAICTESLSLSVGLVNGNIAPEENQSYDAGAK